jgi:hypothetical protein
MAEFYSLRDLSHDPKLANALSNMVVTWAFAEVMLFATLARITGIGLNMAMAAHYRIPTFEARAKFILALLPDWKTKEFDKDQIGATIGKLGQLAKTRNHWVHGDWCANADKTQTVIFDQRAPINSKGRSKPVKAIDAIVEVKRSRTGRFFETNLGRVLINRAW